MATESTESTETRPGPAEYFPSPHHSCSVGSQDDAGFKETRRVGGGGKVWGSAGSVDSVAIFFLTMGTASQPEQITLDFFVGP